MKKFLKIVIVFTALLAGLVACESLEVQKPMVKVDTMYIPVWISLQEGDLENATFFMERLKTEWELLQILLVDEHDFGQWEREIDRVDKLLTEASWAIKEENSIHAFVAIDRIRYKLIRLRSQYEIDYFLDDIWAFQIAYADFQEVADDDVLCWLGWDNVAKMEKELSLLWKPVYKTNKLPEYLEFTVADEVQFIIRQRTIDAKLVALRAALDCADREQMALVGTSLGQEINEMIKLFGNFDKQSITDQLVNK